MKGYPIGYIMLWSSPDDYDNTGHIGKNEKMYKRPDDLVIDGQQRLTALLAAMYGVTIKDKNYKERNTRISFNPLIREFAVWTQAYEKDTEWISEISAVFAADQEHNISKFRKAYIKAANEGRQKNNVPDLTEDEEDVIEENINDLLNLGIYSLPTLKINAKADEENVADIFVRVNSGGQNLTENPFLSRLVIHISRHRFFLFLLQGINFIYHLGIVFRCRRHFYKKRLLLFNLLFDALQFLSMGIPKHLRDIGFQNLNRLSACRSAPY